MAEVTLDPGRKRNKKPRCYGKLWAFPMPWFAFIWPETQRMGEQAYAENPRRSEWVRSINGEIQCTLDV